MQLNPAATAAPQAYQVLSDPARRKAYNAELSQNSSQSRTSKQARSQRSTDDADGYYYDDDDASHTDESTIMFACEHGHKHSCKVFRYEGDVHGAPPAA